MLIYAVRNITQFANLWNFVENRRKSYQTEVLCHIVTHFVNCIFHITQVKRYEILFFLYLSFFLSTIHPSVFSLVFLLVTSTEVEGQMTLLLAVFILSIHPSFLLSVSMTPCLSFSATLGLPKTLLFQNLLIL